MPRGAAGWPGERRDLAVAIDAMPDPAVPVADFGGKSDHQARLFGHGLGRVGARHDPGSVHSRHTAAVTLPFRAARQDRGDLLIFAWPGPATTRRGLLHPGTPT